MPKHLDLNRLAGFFLLVLLLIYFHPYHGIRHDSILYLGQVLLRARPDEFGLDLFFAFGSQASFTFFPDVVAYVMDLVKVPAPVFFMWLTAGSGLFFLLASSFLVFRLFPIGYRFWALISLLLMPAGYGGYRVFSYLEPFFTARSVAEPLLLVALALWFGNRRSWAFLAWGLAAVCHPLQALSALLLVFVDLVLIDRRWLNLLWLVLPFCVLGLMRFGPAEKIFEIYDSQWLEWVLKPSPHLFVLNWPLDAYIYLLLDFFVAFLVWKQSPSVQMSRFSKSAFFATGFAFVVSAVLVDGFNFVLPTGLQLWRMQWILHWFSVAAIPWVLVNSVRSEGCFSLRTVILLACLSLGVQTGGLGVSPFAVPILIFLYFVFPYFNNKIGGVVRYLLFSVVCGVLAFGIVKFSYGVFSLSEKYGGDRAYFREEFVFFSFPLVGASLVAGCVFLWRSANKYRWVLFLVFVFSFLHACKNWDRRTVWTRQIELSENVSSVFGVEIESGAQVFWDGELLAPWLILNRASYFDGQQAAGLAFSRGTAEEAYKRKDVTEIIQFQRQICGVVNSLPGEHPHCKVDDSVVVDACRQSGRKLSYLVLSDVLNTPFVGSWSIKGGVVRDEPLTYYLYRCKDFY